MKRIKSISIIIAVLSIIISCQNRDSESIAEVKPTLQKGIDHGPEESLAGFLNYIGASSADLNEMETDRIIEKYKEVGTIYAGNFYSKATKIRLIREIITRGDYEIKTIPYLLNELEEEFITGVYPKEAYLLLKEAEVKKAIGNDEINSIAKSQYAKAEIHFTEWQRLANLDSSSPDLQHKMNAQASTINGLRNSALEKLQYSERLEEFFIKD